MNYLKLVINNGPKKIDVFFNKAELKLILNLYARMVSNGEWKDYGLSLSKKEVSFNIYHRTSEVPAFKITKNFKPKNKQEKYIVKDSSNKIIKSSENLENLIKQIFWKKFKLVN
tara:strand:- start:701 stop:1042 length:342 start_codon:yes stop_codon:yes gene_type:complete